MVLAVATFTLNAISIYFVRLLPPLYSRASSHAQSQSESETLQRAVCCDVDGRQSLESEPPGHSRGDDLEEAIDLDSAEDSLLLSKPSTPAADEERLGWWVSEESQLAEVDIRGWALLAMPQFWHLFLMFGLLSGIGLMNIK